MKVDSLYDLDLKNKILVIGDCATNHVEDFSNYKNVVSRQIQGGIGTEPEIAAIQEPSAIMLFVSWANALSVIDDEDIYRERLNSHLSIIRSLKALNVRFLMIDRHGFLDRFASTKFLNGRESVPYPQALREGWRPQNFFEQVDRRNRYRSQVKKLLTEGKDYFDLAAILGVSTYRHESGECKNNLVNVAPWHYDPDTYKYAAKILDAFVASQDLQPLMESWELGVLKLKTGQ